jgi:hypothetical protein
MAAELRKERLAPMEGGIRVEGRAETPERVEVAERAESPKEPEEQAVSEPAPPTTPVQAVARVMRAPKDRMTAEVEAVLSEGLEEIYRQLSPDERAAFRRKGEETAKDIQALLLEAKVNVKKVFDAIRDWLKLLSDRANKFYLEQEAKIKMDKLLLLAAAEKRERENAVT